VEVLATIMLQFRDAPIM